MNARHRMLLSVETMTSRVSQISHAETELSAPEEDRINLLENRAHSEAAATLPDGWDAPATPDLDITQGSRDGAPSNPPGVASGGLSCDGSCACPAPPPAPLSPSASSTVSSSPPLPISSAPLPAPVPAPLSAQQLAFRSFAGSGKGKDPSPAESARATAAQRRHAATIAADHSHLDQGEILPPPCAKGAGKKGKSEAPENENEQF